MNESQKKIVTTNLKVNIENIVFVRKIITNVKFENGDNG